MTTATNAPTRVGIVGANPERGWAIDAHIPALQALPNYEITAVSTTRRQSADAAAAATGATAAFIDNAELANCADVDLVAVNVKVPAHFGAVAAALEAGKDVWCEWPLGRTLEEAQTLADMARQRGARTVVGLQARVDPSLLHVRNLIRQGAIGEVLSTTMVGAMRSGNTALPAAYDYMADSNSGSNLLTVVGGHSLDILCMCLGEFTELSATVATRRSLVTVQETGEVLDNTAPDQVAVVGRLDGGAVACVHLREGTIGGTSFWWEVNGREGTLRVTGRSGHPGVTRTTLTIERPSQLEPEILVPPAAYEQDASPLNALAGGPAYNVARSYAGFAGYLSSDELPVADFAHAVRRHQTIAAIEASARDGNRQVLKIG
jgi:predicted dehydrogenase